MNPEPALNHDHNSLSMSQNALRGKIAHEWGHIWKDDKFNENDKEIERIVLDWGLLKRSNLLGIGGKTIGRE